MGRSFKHKDENSSLTTRIVIPNAAEMSSVINGVREQLTPEDINHFGIDKMTNRYTKWLQKRNTSELLKTPPQNLQKHPSPLKTPPQNFGRPSTKQDKIDPNLIQRRKITLPRPPQDFGKNSGSNEKE